MQCGRVFAHYVQAGHGQRRWIMSTYFYVLKPLMTGAHIASRMDFPQLKWNALHVADSYYLFFVEINHQHPFEMTNTTLHCRFNGIEHKLQCAFCMPTLSTFGTTYLILQIAFLCFATIHYHDFPPHPLRFPFWFGSFEKRFRTSGPMVRNDVAIVVFRVNFRCSTVYSTSSFDFNALNRRRRQRRRRWA